ncbi:hypothetical protein D6C77_06946 [Aureobasidium pullulans]|nr:hypothetical protein D6C77_06946 [Aureobasidium pullulans]
MSSQYIRHITSDPDDDQHIMPPVPNPDEPKHPLGPRIYIRLLVNTSDAGWTAYWEDFHMNERLGMGWIPGATFWWEEKQRWLVPEETPAKVGMEHGHTLRIITAKEPEAHDTVPLVRLHDEKVT